MAMIAPTGSKARCVGDQTERFNSAVDAIFQSWTGLHLARENTCPAEKGRQAYDEMLAAVKAWFDRDGEVYADELSLYMTEAIDDAMSATLEDGSVDEVSRLLNKTFRECAVSNYESVDQLLMQAADAQGAAVGSACVEDSHAEFDKGDDDDQDEAGAPPADTSGLPPMDHQQIRDVLDRFFNDITSPAHLQGYKSPHDILRTIYTAAVQHMQNEGVEVPCVNGVGPAQQPPPQQQQQQETKRRKKSGKNTIEMQDDGWATVK
ncbi:pre-rRNA-processing protein TSR2 [Diplonema papillatum]|nr:pre-rRNA-processing protein TSR2 [Diplonema papillatum]